MNGLLNFFKSFGNRRMMAIFGVAVGVAATLAFTVFRVGQTPMALLYSDLELSEVAEITAILDQTGVKWETEGDGSVLLVERGEVASTRLQLANQGLPSSGSVGYEIFDQGNALGQTQFVQDINRQRALEGEHARTVRALDGVNWARVQLVLPERRAFQQNTDPVTASVVVGYSRRPTPENIAAIQHVIANATPGLQPENVVVIDRRTGVVLGGGDGMGGAELMATRRQGVEAALQEKVLDIVEGIVGEGNAHVSITADLNLARTTTQEETFDPDGQVVRSSQVGEDTSSNGLAAVPGGEATIGNNVPEGAGATNSNSSRSGSTSEVTNYEISKTIRTEVVEPGQINRLTVAVTVDGITGPVGEDGTPGEWQPQSQEDLDAITDLVQAAVGYDEARGDLVTVRNTQFQRQALPVGGVEAAGGMFAGFEKNDLMRGVELFVLLIVAGLTIFFVARPLLKGITSGGGGMQPMPMMAGAGAGGGEAVLANSSGPASAQLPYDPSTGAPTTKQVDAPKDSGIDIARIEGQVKASAIKQVSEFADRHPEESVSILRGWLHEG